MSPRQLLSIQIWMWTLPLPLPLPLPLLRLLTLGPVIRAEQRSRARGKGANVRAHGCASLRRPETGEQRRERRSRAMLGSPFFWLLFFGGSKKSDSATAEVDETVPGSQVARVKRVDSGVRRNDEQELDSGVRRNQELPAIPAFTGMTNPRVQKKNPKPAPYNSCIAGFALGCRISRPCTKYTTYWVMFLA